MTYALNSCFAEQLPVAACDINSDNKHALYSKISTFQFVYIINF